MKTLNYAEALARFAEVFASVVNDREEVVITQAGHASVVIVALDDYEALQKTVRLLRSPRRQRACSMPWGEMQSAEVNEPTRQGLPPQGSTTKAFQTVRRCPYDPPQRRADRVCSGCVGGDG